MAGLAAALRAGGRLTGPGEAEQLAVAFADRLPASYFERTLPAAAAVDLAHLEALAAMPAGPGPGALQMAVQPDPDPAPGMFRLRLYSRAGVVLSSFLPVLESFGLLVIEAVPHRVEVPGSGAGHFHLDDFGLRPPGRCPFDPRLDGPRLVDAIAAAWRGDTAVDSLNRLVVYAGLDQRATALLRAYRQYRRQAGTTWSDRQLDDPLVAFPQLTRDLLAWFAARFDPVEGSPRAAEAARRTVVEASGDVDRLEQDQVMRGYIGLIDATVRTNYYQRGAEGTRPTLTLKLDSGRVPELPAPRPHIETFVYSPRFEGLHLRWGPVARGGIRWSDRQDDLRTEVLGLARAQVLKNAIIVPTGAKGGFVCRRLAGDAERPATEVAAEVRACYAGFIGGLLDITDNVVAGRIVTPDGVRPADGPDPYLVVAADRGTASFSDLANQISAERGFWLGDAFASGGSHGYDHKAMGITARGAWLAVRQHFRQLGIDTQTERIRVTGVGDMSGDVFGNGMLQSRTIALVAAFDHRDVFLDPDPDPERSFEERRRLASLPGSSWEDYDRSVLSTGGGVWSRTAKQVPLSPEARAVLGATAEALSPPEVITAILAAPADLLWFGGIGTYVKATNESHADVGDHADDTVRIDADRVRARVVAEGGNLGFTQRARIQYSRRGGKINTDFIDNAAGVAISDREVNVKVLLALAVEQGRLAPGDRDGLLVGSADEVAASVLRLVGRSTAALARAVPESAADLDAHEALMAGLEGQGRLDRKVEALPEAEEMATRRAAGAGLIRPELAVLAAYAKSDLADAVEASPLARDPSLRGAVEAYFPPDIRARFADLVGEHRLYVPLAATTISGEIVDRMGVTWAHETAEEWGLGLAEVAAAYWAARQVTGAETRWRLLEDLVPTVDADTEAHIHALVVDLVAGVARSYLRRRGIEPASVIEADQPYAAELAPPPAAGGSSGAAGGAPAPSEIDRLVALGLDRAAAVSFAGLAALRRVADVAAVSRAVGRPAAEVLEGFAAVDEALGLAVLDGRLAGLVPGGRWERWQLRSLADDIAAWRRRAVEQALRSPGPPADAVAAFLGGRGERRARLDRLVSQWGGPGREAPALAALAVRALADLIGGEPAAATATGSPPGRAAPPGG